MRVDEALALVKTLDAQDVGVKFKVTNIAKGVNGYSVKAIKMIPRTNLMSNVIYFEDEDTPNYMSPASESYWSM